MKSTSKDDILLFHNAYAKPLDYEDFDGDIKWIMDLRKNTTTYVSNASESDLFTPIWTLENYMIFLICRLFAQ